MALTNLQNLSTADKLLVLSTTAGLQQLEEWLSAGLSLSRIARILDIQTDTMYRWCHKYPDITEVVAKYISLEDLTRPPAYRIICNYEDNRTSIGGSIYAEYDTPEELWNSNFIKDYFNFWKIDGTEYYEQYIKALRARGVYQLSHYICIAFCNVSAKGKIKALAPQI